MAKPISMAVPNDKLEAARRKKLLSVSKLSELVEVDPKTYYRWSMGLQLPHLRHVDMLCKVLGMTPEELGFENIIARKISSRKRRQETVSIAVPELPNLPVLPGPAVSTVNLREIGTRAWKIVQQQYGWSLKETCTHFEEAMMSYNDMREQQKHEEEPISRRQILTLAVGMPIALFNLTQTGNRSPFFVEEILLSCEAGIPACWQLYYEGGHLEVKRVLPGYLSQLSTLAQQPSRYQKRAASFASQAYQLAYMIALQEMYFDKAIDYCEAAFKYGQIAGDYNLQVASLIRKGVASFYKKRPTQTLEAYQEAMQYVNGVSPLLLSRVYSGLAESNARLGRDEEARRYLNLARDTFPDHPEYDPNFLYTHFNHFILATYDVLTYFDLGQPDEAWQVLKEVEGLVPSTVVPQRVELLIYRARAAVALGYMEKSCTYLEAAATSAQKIGSDLRYAQSCDIYESIQTKWGREQRIKLLGRIFQK